MEEIMKTKVEEKCEQYCSVTPRRYIQPLFLLRSNIQESQKDYPDSWHVPEDEALGYLLDALISIYVKPLQEHLRIAEDSPVSTDLANRASAIREAGVIRDKFEQLRKEHGTY